MFYKFFCRYWYRKVKYPRGIGADLGLVVLLNADNNDYYYPLNNMQGFRIHIFNAEEFPDETTGSVHTESLDLSKEVFLRLKASTLNSVDLVSSFTTKQVVFLFFLY